MSENVIRVREDNYDALLNSNFKLNEDFSVTLNAGASHLSRYLRQTGNTGSQFVVPAFMPLTIP